MIEFVTGNYEHARWYYIDLGDRPNGYYFWNESSTGCCGPYPTAGDCEEAQDRYENHYP